MDKKHFLFKLIPPRPTFAQDTRPEEQRLMQEHITYFKALKDKGLVLLFGPVQEKNGSYGLSVLEVEDEAAARQIAENDPTVKAGLNTAEIYPMRLG
jgi:uncharacterized protein YciI